MVHRQTLAVVVVVVVSAVVGLVLWQSAGGSREAAPGLAQDGETRSVKVKVRVSTKDGEPVEKALVRIGDGLLTAVTDGNGVAEATVLSAFLSEDIEARVSRQGYAPKSLVLPAPVKGVSTLDVALETALPLRSLSIRAESASKIPLPGLRLLLGVLDPTDGAVGPQEVVVAGPEGLIEIPVYDESATFRLEAADEGWMTMDYPVLLSAEEWPASQGTYPLIARPVSTLAVSIETKEGSHERADFAVLLPDWSEDVGHAWTPQERSAVFQYAGMPGVGGLPDALLFRKVPKGRYRLLASRRGGCLAESVVTVRAGEGLRSISLPEPEWDSVPVVVRSAEGAPVPGAIIGPCLLRLNDWTQLLNVWCRLNPEAPLKYVLHGEASGVASVNSLSFLANAGWGVTDREGKATACFPRGSRMGFVFVPGRGIVAHDFRSGRTLRLPRPVSPEMRVEGPPLAPGGGVRVIAWVENPFPVGGQYPEPVAAGFLTPVAKDGRSLPPLLPPGRYRAAVMDLGREIEPLQSGESVQIEVDETGKGFPPLMTLAER